MSEKYKSRKSEPVYSSTYDNGGWPAREELPTKDPIGDIDDHIKDAVRYMTAHQAGLNRDEEVDEWVEGYNKWQADQKAYEEKMKPHLIKPEGKVGIDFIPTKITISHKPECNCGVKAVYGDIPAHNHKDYCDLFKAAKNNV